MVSFWRCQENARLLCVDSLVTRLLNALENAFQEHFQLPVFIVIVLKVVRDNSLRTFVIFEVVGESRWEVTAFIFCHKCLFYKA